MLHNVQFNQGNWENRENIGVARKGAQGARAPSPIKKPKW